MDVRRGDVTLLATAFFPDFPFLLDTHVLHSLYGVFHLNWSAKQRFGLG